MTDKKSSSLDFSKIYSLESIISYQEGAVVSRQLLKNAAGTITIFAFAEGEGLSEHTTPYNAMVHVLDGQVTITIANEKYTLSTGEIIIMPANVPHALQAIKRFKMMLIMLKEK